VQRVPFEDERFDQVLLWNVLTAAEAPARAVAEAARVLVPGGDLSIVTLEAHEHPRLTAAYGHLHPGFRVSTLRKWIEKAGLSLDRCEIGLRERRQPYFNIITASARKPA
jgi:ArsR family transcriptional regulator